MVFSEFRRRFDVLAPHLTKKHGRNYIVMDEKRVSVEAFPFLSIPPPPLHTRIKQGIGKCPPPLPLQKPLWCVINYDYTGWQHTAAVLINYMQ